MKLLDGYALSKGAAEKSARGKGLSAAQVDYLEAASR
jgi:hypothetical protein